MVTTSPGAIVERAVELARAGAGSAPAALEQLMSMVDGDRSVLEEARDQVAARLHHRSDDWEATGALTLLNRALAQAPRVDPLDWRERWARHRKP
jgi:hypothetical protein